MDFLIELVFPIVVLGMTYIGTGSEAEADDAELYDPTKTVYPGLKHNKIFQNIQQAECHSEFYIQKTVNVVCENINVYRANVAANCRDSL